MPIVINGDKEPERQAKWTIGDCFPRVLEDEARVIMEIDGRELRAVISMIHNMSGDTQNSKLRYRRH